MGKRERYKPGTFCWADLATTDPAGAKAFYSGLFGWEAEDVPAGEAGTYTLMRLDGDEVCGLYEMDAERREAGAPPYWLSHVSVEDVDAVAARAGELGGAVEGGVFDVGEYGRFAMVRDPAGAVLVAWQTGASAGARRVNDPGCMTWNELNTREPERMAAFYAELFGWEMEAQRQNGSLAYVTIRNAGSSNGGIMPMSEQHGEAPSFWLTYFTVSSCDDAVARARELGGEVLAGPMEPGAGRIAVLADPQGAAFAVFEGETDE
ncbi:MAG TPA: VOC family protein [Rubrobacteraceae bacterium]|nr:VOC family protein [Rubrobacteraceae bacterium]